MNVIVLGGTQFIGRHIVDVLLAHGDRVSVLTRGKTRDDLPSSVERLRGDRNDGADGLAALGARRWDACVDVSGYTPRQVRASAEHLRDLVSRYVFISTVSVYADSDVAPLDESHPRAEPAGEDVTEVTFSTYGPLKVTCEDIVQTVFGDRAAILRPQIVAGAHDPTGRYPYWIQRASQGGEVLAPGDGSDHLQVIDVQDLARFTRTAIVRGLSGAFNLAGPRITWAEFMRLIGVEQPVWIDAGTLRDAGVTFAELPLFLADGGPRSNLMHVSAARALAAGLVLSDPADTVRSVREWLRAIAITPALSPERERELLARARARVTLRPATTNDVAILRRWDEAPHVIESDPNDEWHWETELARTPDWREQLMAEVGGRPVGFLQIIDPAREESHYWGDVSGDLRAVDIWIGEADDLGKGYGTQMMRLALERCFAAADVTAVLIDPLASNTRAHRFYERLGFRFVERRRFGDDDCFVYRLDRANYEAARRA
jgi:2'-hydroxyisoflavone reductase